MRYYSKQQRVVAIMLLFSHTLMSCSPSNIGPNKNSLVPLKKPNNTQHATQVKEVDTQVSTRPNQLGLNLADGQDKLLANTHKATEYNQKGVIVDAQVGAAVENSSDLVAKVALADNNLATGQQLVVATRDKQPITWETNQPVDARVLMDLAKPLEKPVTREGVQDGRFRMPIQQTALNKASKATSQPSIKKSTNLPKTNKKETRTLAASHALRASQELAHAKRLAASRAGKEEEEMPSTHSRQVRMPSPKQASLSRQVANRQVNRHHPAFMRPKGYVLATVQTEPIQELPRFGFSLYIGDQNPFLGNTSREPALLLGCSITTREGHQVRFIQDLSQWLAVVQENCAPGFSRSHTLPVYHPVYEDAAGLRRQIQHNVERVLSYLPAAQRNLVHVVFPNQDVEKGYVYTGPVMGLEGGGWGNWWGGTIALVAVGVAVGAAVAAMVLASGAILGITIFGFSMEVGVLGFSLFSGGLVAALRAALLIERNIFLSKISECVEGLERKEETYFQNIEELSSKMDKDSTSYININTLLAELNGYRSNIVDGINTLKRYKDDPSPIKELASEDHRIIDNHIEAREQQLKKLDAKIQEIRVKARNQALTAFNKDYKHIETEDQKALSKVDDCLMAIITNNLSISNQAIQDAKQQFTNNLAKLKVWQKVPAFFSEDQIRIGTYINLEQSIQAKVERINQLINYVKADHFHAQRIHKLVSTNTLKELTEICSAAIRTGEAFLVHYIVIDKQLYRCMNSDETSDMLGNTLLHQAVNSQKIDIVAFLLQQGAKVSIKNGTDETPLDLAKANKNVRIIELLQNSKNV